MLLSQPSHALSPALHATVLLLLCITRPNITVSSLVFCVTVLYGQHTQGFAQLWAHDVGAVCLAGATAAAAVLLAASLVLPSAASEEVRAGGVAGNG
jgi:hypothetical protein